MFPFGDKMLDFEVAFLAWDGVLNYFYDVAEQELRNNMDAASWHLFAIF